jgi:hypothetical protein
MREGRGATCVAGVCSTEAKRSAKRPDCVSRHAQIKKIILDRFPWNLEINEVFLERSGYRKINCLQKYNFLTKLLKFLPANSLIILD